MIPGTEGYEAHARALIPQYEAVAFEHKYAALLHLLPTKRAQVLDIGAGAGGDAAWFVARGHTVVAVEPVAGFRRVAMDTHRAPCIEWVDDHLPLLTRVCQRGQCFDLVSLMAVWMHLNAAEREAGMGILAGLLAPDGVLLMSLRHGPVPSARRMFASADVGVPGAERLCSGGQSRSWCHVVQPGVSAFWWGCPRLKCARRVVSSAAG
jgi:SAM-dependent methyltransferase